jgi:hypothetical protein
MILIKVDEYGCIEEGCQENDAGMENPEGEAKLFRIFPNPAKETVLITAVDIMEQIELYDLSGRILRTVTPKTIKTELKLGNLSSGVYLLKVRLKNGGTKTEKLIIQ